MSVVVVVSSWLIVVVALLHCCIVSLLCWLLLLFCCCCCCCFAVVSENYEEVHSTPQQRYALFSGATGLLRITQNLCVHNLLGVFSLGRLNTLE